MNFRDFEHAGWEKLPQRYDAAWGSLTSQSIGPLLDAVGVEQGTKLLDLASGPGYLAGAAAQRGADVLGVDFSAAMVRQARQRYPQVRFEEGDAEALTFKDDSFDAVTMAFGLLHLARPEQALREACRVLRPGGRFAFTVWAKPEETRGFGIVLGAIRKHGDLNAPIPSGPPFFRFSEEAESRRALLEAGFAAPQFRKIPQTWRLQSPQDLWEFMLGGTVRTGALLRAQTPGALQAIRAEVIAASDKELPMPAVLATAMKGTS